MNEEVDRDIARMGARVAAHKAIGVEFLQREIGVLCRTPPHTLDVSATIGDAIEMMQRGHVGAVVITEQQKLAGILTERDLLMKMLGKQEDSRDRPVTEIMTANPECLRKGDELVYLMNAMHVGGFRHMPIVDENDVPLHVVSLRSVLAYLLDQFSDEIKNIPPAPFRGERKRYSG
jgi:CBS domain-containing protein